MSLNELKEVIFTLDIYDYWSLSNLSRVNNIIGQLHYIAYHLYVCVHPSIYLSVYVYIYLSIHPSF